MFASHDGAAQVDGRDAVECSLSDLVERRVPAGDADADIVVKNVDSSPTPLRGLGHRRESCLFGNVRFERDAFSTRLSRHRDGFLGGGKIVIDGHHPGAFLSEAQNRSAAVAQSLARRLTSTDDDGDLVFEAHADLGRKWVGARQTLRVQARIEKSY